MTKSSALSGLYKLPREERIRLVSEFASLADGQRKLLLSDSPLKFDAADRMSENAVGMHGLPFSVATNFIVNGKEAIVPMAIEEPSVVAAASNGAKLCRDTGGFSASADPPIMIGQVQLVGCKDAEAAAKRLDERKEEALAAAAPFAENIAKYGGGLRGFAARVIGTPRGKMVVAEFHIDVRDSMGANTINTILEGAAPEIERISGDGKARLRILSNLAVARLARATAIWKKETIGAEAVEGVLDAWAFAEGDIFRAATHNKGIMNGIDAVALATGNDWRAVEAGAHAYASMGGRYRPLTRFKRLPNGDLHGEIELPLAVGILGGATRSLPMAQAALSILGAQSSGELASLMASVGLAQNFAALRALSTEGIQKGHMALHAKNVALAAGASGAVADDIAEKMAKEKDITASRAGELLAEHQKRKKPR